jgi:adenylyltransferase/sulfurtransferase
VLTNEIYEVRLSASASGMELLPKTEAAFLAMSYNDACRAKQSSVVEIDAEEFNKLRKKTSSVVIDVREKGELPLLTNFDHHQIPMSVFKESVLNIKADVIILFCQHGVRSLHAAEMVHNVFGTAKEVYSLKGGVVKWGDQLGLRIWNHRDSEHTE